MTSTEFRAILATLAWTPTVLARVLGCARSLAWRWHAGDAAVPCPVAAWLRAMATAHQRLPPPAGWQRAA